MKTFVSLYYKLKKRNMKRGDIVLCKKNFSFRDRVDGKYKMVRLFNKGDKYFVGGIGTPNAPYTGIITISNGGFKEHFLPGKSSSKDSNWSYFDDYFVETNETKLSLEDLEKFTRYGGVKIFQVDPF